MIATHGMFATYDATYRCPLQRGVSGLLALDTNDGKGRGHGTAKPATFPFKLFRFPSVYVPVSMRWVMLYATLCAVGPAVRDSPLPQAFLLSVIFPKPGAGMSFLTTMCYVSAWYDS